VTRSVPDAARLAAWRDFLLAHTRVMRALERDLKREFGLTGAQYDVLFRLAETPGCRMRMSDLARALLYSSGAATKLLDPLVTAGLACRETDPADRRTVYAAITDAGRDRLGAANREHLKAIQREFGAHLPTDEITTVAAFLARLAHPEGT
jgi:DNA-binding MarR family transcriptional regulator